MSDIVLVHGIAQERLSADSLEESWLPALAGGVRIAGFADVADRIVRRPAAPAPLDTRMAFYGNLFRQPDAQGADAEVPADSAELAEQIGYQWLLAAAARATDTKSRSVAVEGAVEIGGQAALAALDSGIGWEMQGKGAVLRNVINAVARIPWFGPQGFALAERF